MIKENDKQGSGFFFKQNISNIKYEILDYIIIEIFKEEFNLKEEDCFEI